MLLTENSGVILCFVLNVFLLLVRSLLQSVPCGRDIFVLITCDYILYNLNRTHTHKHTHIHTHTHTHTQTHKHEYTHTYLFTDIFVIFVYEHISIDLNKQ